MLPSRLHSQRDANACSRPTPERGTISVTEKVSALGVYLIKIDLVAPQIPTERQ